MMNVVSEPCGAEAKPERNHANQEDEGTKYGMCLF